MYIQAIPNLSKNVFLNSNNVNIPIIVPQTAYVIIHLINSSDVNDFVIKKTSISWLDIIFSQNK